MLMWVVPCDRVTQRSKLSRRVLMP
jgi:hypothetical protein